jgi:1,2-diacylglycerol 3-beta-galactosyltransferase
MSLPAGKKRILVLTADVGFGHRSVSNAIAEAIQDAYSDTLDVNVINPLDDPRVPKFIRSQQTDYDKLVRTMPRRYRLQYQFGDLQPAALLVETVLVATLFNVIFDLLQVYSPDLVIVTNTMFVSPMSAVTTIYNLNLPIYTVITDLANVHRLWFNDGVTLTLVANEAVFQQALDMGLPPERVRITGVPVKPEASKETRSRAAIRASLGWDPQLTTALVVGSARVKNLEKVLDVINHSGLPLQLVIVAGKDDELYRWLQETEWHLPSYCYYYTNELITFMHASDIILTKAGGAIISEAFACGLPLLFVDVTPGQEEPNASYVVNNGAGELATEPLVALETLRCWLADGKRLLDLHARRSLELGHICSAYTIADLAYKAVQGEFLPVRHPHSSVQPRIRKLLENLNIIGQNSSN